MGESVKEGGIPIERLASRLAATGPDGSLNELKAEFAEIEKATPVFDNFRLHASKNRYHGNIFLYDHTRVILRDNPNGDYIHASYISTPRQNHRFILTQAPLPETIGDFWHMIAQEQSQIIVALCQFDERGVKTDDPFPVYWTRTKGETRKYNHIQVRYVESTSTSSMTITTLMVSKADVQLHQHVTHLHLKAAGWDEHGTPTQQLQELMDAVWLKEEQMSQLNHVTHSTPMVIHCGSGTTRSGQFCAFALFTESDRQRWLFSPKETVGSLQSQRYGVLREPSQVMAVFYALVEYGKRHKIIQDGNIDNVLRSLKEKQYVVQTITEKQA